MEWCYWSPLCSVRPCKCCHSHQLRSDRSQDTEDCCRQDWTEEELEWCLSSEASEDLSKILLFFLLGWKLFFLTWCDWVQRECSVEASSLEYCLHDEVVRSMDPKWIISKSLSEYLVSLWNIRTGSNNFYGVVIKLSREDTWEEKCWEMKVRKC